MSKPKLTSAARALIDKALRAMGRHPDSVDMDLWIAHDTAVRGKHPYCGTVACLAGHITLAAGFPQDSYPERAQVPTKYKRLVATTELRTSDIACRLIGIDRGGPAYSALFGVEGWPETYRAAYRRAKNDRARARATITRVRHWLATGE